MRVGAPARGVVRGRARAWASRRSSRPSTASSPSTRRSSTSWPSGCRDDADPLRDVVFIVRTGALFPVYRTFSLLEQLKGRVRVPTVLFYPGDSTAPPAFASWACSTPSTTTARRSSERGAAMTTTQTIKAPLRQRHRRGASRRSSRSTRPTRRSSATRSTSTSSPTAIRAPLHGDPRGATRDAEQAARGDRRLGLGLLRLRQVELRQDARPRAREPDHRRRAAPASCFAERAGDKKLAGPARPTSPRRSRRTP